MLPNKRSAKMEAVAAVIAENAGDVRDVRFTSELVRKISAATKLLNGKPLTSRLNYLWNLRDSVLKLLVREILLHDKSSDNDASKPKAPCKTSETEILTAKTHDASKVTGISNPDVDFEKIDVKGDGNCLFRVFAIHLFNDESRHYEVRKSIIQYVIENWESNVGILTATCVDKFYKNAKDYENFMGRDGEQGTDFELGMFVKVYKVDTTVYQENNDQFCLKYPLTCSEESVGKLNILFTGTERSGHWMLLNSKQESCEEKKDEYEQSENETDSLNMKSIESSINDEMTLTGTAETVECMEITSNGKCEQLEDKVNAENLSFITTLNDTAENGKATAKQSKSPTEGSSRETSNDKSLKLTTTFEKSTCDTTNVTMKYDSPTKFEPKCDKNSTDAVFDSNDITIITEESNNVLSNASDSLENEKSDKTLQIPVAENVSAILTPLSFNTPITNESTTAANKDSSNDTIKNNTSLQLKSTFTDRCITDPVGEYWTLSSEDEEVYTWNQMYNYPSSPLLDENDVKATEESERKNVFASNDSETSKGMIEEVNSTLETFCKAQSNLEENIVFPGTTCLTNKDEMNDTQLLNAPSRVSTTEDSAQKALSELESPNLLQDEEVESKRRKRKIFTRTLQQRHPDGDVGYRMYEYSDENSEDSSSDKQYSAVSDSSSDDDSNKEYTDSEFQNICKEVQNKKRKGNKKEKKEKKEKKDKKFKVDIGTVEIDPNSFRNETRSYDKEKIRQTLSYILRDAYRCTCLLAFYGEVRLNRRSISAYAKCTSAEHIQSFKFEIHNLNDDLAKIVIKSDDEIKLVHKRDADDPKYLPLRGTERKEIKEKLKSQSVNSLSKQVVKENSTELLADGHPGTIRRTYVYYKANSEDNSKNRLNLESYDLADLFQMWVDESKLKDPFLRIVGLDLTAQMYAQKDLDLISTQKNVILHIDATGSIVRKPEGLDCKRILYYCLLARHKIEVIKLAHMITSEHDTTSIGNWLNNFKSFANKAKKWPVANIVVTDQAWATVHAIMIQWNNMKVERYLQLTYNVLCQKENVPNDFISVKFCFAHFSHNITETIDKLYVARKNDEKYPTFKQVLKGCIQLLCVSRTLTCMKDLFGHVCRIFLNKSLAVAADSIQVITGLRNTHNSKFETAAAILTIDENDAELNAIIDDMEKSDTIYRNSPYYKIFNAIMVTEQQKAEEPNEEEFSVEKINPFYAPEFMDKVIVKWMPYAILWSSLDLDMFAPDISRVSNAYIESSNKTMKELVLKGYTRSSIGNVVRALKTDQESVRALIRADENLKGTKKSHKKPLYPTVESEGLVLKDTPTVRKACKEAENSQVQSEGNAISRKSSQKRKIPESKLRTSKIPQNAKARMADTKENVPSNPYAVESWAKKKQPRRQRTAKINIDKLFRVGRLFQDEEKTRKPQVLKKNEEINVDDMVDEQNNNQNESVIEKKISTRKRDHSPSIEDSNPCKIPKLTSFGEEENKTLVEKKISTRKRDHSPSIEDSNPCKIPKLTSFGEEENKTLVEQSLGELNLIKEEKNDEKCTFRVERFFNGLVKDPYYYMNWEKSEITIARYEVNKFINKKEFWVTTREFPTLLKPGWVNLTIIDAFAAACLDQWMDLTYVSTDDTTPIIGVGSEKRVNKNLRISQTTETLHNTVFMPYVFNRHCQLAILNIEKEELTLLNPYESWDEYTRVAEALKHFIDNSSEGSTFNRLKNINWTKGDIMKNRPYQPPQDTENCGLYIMHYIDCIGKQKPFDMNFNPLEFRKKAAHLLLLKSVNMEDQCMYCSSKKKELKKLKCHICQRQNHEKCTIRSDNENYLRISNKENYICKFCRKYEEFVKSEEKT